MEAYSVEDEGEGVSYNVFVYNVQPGAKIDYKTGKVKGEWHSLCIHNEKSDNKQENCLYQVVDRSLNGVFLQNLSNNKVFEETNIQKELLDKIGNDYILRYEDGEYVYDEELTDKFMERVNWYQWVKTKKGFLTDY